ncbi:MAG: hypothetical protein ACPGVO_11560 [Spirulinaceae cyanobacterium]
MPAVRAQNTSIIDATLIQSHGASTNNTPDTSTLQTTTLPEFLTEPGSLRKKRYKPEPKVLMSLEEREQLPWRPDGVHTRIFPFWSPGLYQ